MINKNNIGKEREYIQELESKISELKTNLKEIKSELIDVQEKKEFYQLISDFAFGWEMWFAPNAKIKYCSPSCFDITGFTSNEILASQGISELLVYSTDKIKYTEFLQKSLDQTLVNQSLEFRILTRTKQLRWCNINVRGVYDKLGKYLGIRASIHDITRLKKAMGQIQEMSAAKEVEIKTKKRLQSELSSKERELISFLLQLSQKNELITRIKNKLGEIQNLGKKEIQEGIQLLLEKISQSTNRTLDWSAVESQIEKTHPDFFYRLQTKHPSISVKDKKLCAYIRLGLSSKEIAGLQNITYRSVEIARVRLRKKLNLPQKTRLSGYLVNL